MKKNLAIALLVMLIAVASCSFTNKSFEGNDKDQLLLDLITYVLEKGHYQPKDIDDDFSVKVFEDFINAIDPTKRYFLESDIKEFEKYKYQLDDQIRNKDIGFFNLVYDRLMLRMEDTKSIYKEVLSQPFDYSKKETIDIDYDKQPFTSSKEELKERWKEQLKYATLGTYDSKLTSNQPSTKTKVTTEGDKIMENKGDTIFEDEIPEKPMTPKEAEEASRKYTESTLDDFFDFVGDMKREDWFVQYINTIVEEFDPHTFYFAPEDKDKFDMSMSGKFEGIGARLQKRKDQTKIVEVISGGPVWRDQRLEVGDEIIKVGQDGEPPVNIVGMRLDDAI